MRTRSHDSLFQGTICGYCAAPDDPLAQKTGYVSLADLEGAPCSRLGYGSSSLISSFSAGKVSGAARGNQRYRGYKYLLRSGQMGKKMGVDRRVPQPVCSDGKARRDPDLIVRRINDARASRQISSDSLGARTSASRSRLCFCWPGSFGRRPASILHKVPGAAEGVSCGSFFRPWLWRTVMIVKGMLQMITIEF